MTKADGQIIIDTRIDTKGITTGAQNIKSKLSGVMGTVKKIGVAIAAAFAVKQLVSFGKECIALGSDLDEVQNVVDVTFGSMSGVIDQFAKDAISSFGLSELSAKQYTSTIGAMLKSMGFTGDAVTEMSIKMAELTGDMASFYNLDTDTAFQKIRSGISGETEPLKQLGINLSEANLEQFRLNQGMATAYSNMSQQEKALLRYNYLLSVTSDAQGDFARTSDSWANQLRVAKLRLDSIKADLGKGFINLLTPVLRVINTVIAGIAKMASAFKAFTALITGNKSTPASEASATGIPEMSADYDEASESAEEYADATSDAAKATKKAAKENKGYVNGLDSIHQYQSAIASDTASSTPKTAAAKKSPTSTADTGMDFGSLSNGETVIDKTAEKMKALYDKIVKGAQPAIDALKKLYSEGLQKVGSFAGTAVKNFYTEFLVPVGKWVMGEGLPRFINALNDGLMKVNWEKINGGLKNLFQQLAPFATNVGKGLLWFWENVLVPLGTWTMNNVVPRFMETLANVLKIANAVIEAGKPGYEWFWKNVLLPIAKWTGGVFTDVWDKINEALGKFAQWCKDNPGVIKNVTTFVVAFFTALAGIKVITSVLGMVKSLGAVITAVKGFVALLGGPVTIAIAAAIAIGVLLWKNWDTIKVKAKEIWGRIQTTISRITANISRNFQNFIKGCKDVISKGWKAIKTASSTIWNGIKTTLSTVWDAIKTAASTVWNGIKTTLSNIWNGIKTTASTIWNGIKTVVTGVWNAIKTSAGTVFNGISTTVKNVWNTISTTTGTIWAGIKTKVSTAWSGIKTTVSSAVTAVKTKISTTFDSIASKVTALGNKIKTGFKTAFGAITGLIKTPINTAIGVINGMIRGIVTGINTMIGALNKLKFSIPRWVPGLGGKSFGLNLTPIYSYPQIPLLAKGAVIPPNAPFTAVLGDQKSGTNIETPESLLRKIVREEAGSKRNAKYEFKAILNTRVIFDQIIEEAKMRQSLTSRNPFELV